MIGDNNVLVRTLGGKLNIEIIEEDIYMTGEAKFICKGSLLYNPREK